MLSCPVSSFNSTTILPKLTEETNQTKTIEWFWQLAFVPLALDTCEVRGSKPRIECGET